MHSVDISLDRWVEQGLITPEQAAEVRRYEAEHGAPEPATPQPVTPPPRALAVVGEIVGYLGAVLAVSGAAFVVGRTWQDLGDVARLALVLTLTAVVAAGGILAARAAQPSAQRLASVLLLATVALSGWLSWVVAHDVAGLTGDDALARWVTGTLAVVAATVYALRRRALAQLALLASLAAVLTAVVSPWDDSVDSTWMGVAWATLGVAWAALGAARLLGPPSIALAAGGLLAVLGMQTAAAGDGRIIILAAAVALAVAMIALAVGTARLMPLIVPGGIGLLVAVPRLISELVGDAVATWVAVMATGLVLVALAVWLVRERRPETPPAEPPEAPAGAPPGP
ncbi:DUF2157 domain-containing protein [Demequina phytophila]|uniref:DUF2157 domain-containing protein n=1 Tax=Demequina phytophila TaxID=1638981 RepID=UPI0007825399|nr:DUF2157 domain-containing protein [Demequina phytophila]